MKKITNMLLIIFLLIGCEKNKNKTSSVFPEYTETVPGGCAIKDDYMLKSLNSNKDSVSYILLNGNLNLFIGFVDGCCSEYITSTEIGKDTIYAKIQTSVMSMCDCICYYTYNFKFKDVNRSFIYKITIDDTRKFTGVIAP